MHQNPALSLPYIHTIRPEAWILYQQGRKDSFYLQLVPDDAPWPAGLVPGGL